MVIAISVFWYVGYSNKKEKEALKNQYLQNLLAKQKSLEKLATQDLLNNPESDRSVLLNIPTKPELKIIKETSSSTWREYGLDLVKALAPLSQKRPNEIKNTLSAIDNNDPTPLKLVVESRLSHEEAVTNLMKMTVPKDLVSRHQTLIVNLEIVTGLIKNMEQALNRPTIALSSGKLLPSYYQIFLQSLNQVNNDLISRKVILTKDQQAKIFLSFLN